MALKVWNGSSWVSSTSARVWNGSSWVSASAAHVWNGSSWVKFFPDAPTVSLGDYTLIGTAEDVVALNSTIYFTLDSSGIAQVDYGSTATLADLSVNGTPDYGTGTFTLETWLDSGAAGDVEVYVTSTGSTLLAGSSALSTYLSLGTTRTWGLQSTRSSVGVQSKAATLSVSLVQASNRSNVLDTATINIEASATFTT
jgi:hypothetical protein